MERERGREKGGERERGREKREEGGGMGMREVGMYQYHYPGQEEFQFNG